MTRKIIINHLSQYRDIPGLIRQKRVTSSMNRSKKDVIRRIQMVKKLMDWLWSFLNLSSVKLPYDFRLLPIIELIKITEEWESEEKG